jgi:hypothetical protein
VKDCLRLVERNTAVSGLVALGQMNGSVSVGVIYVSKAAKEIRDGIVRRTTRYLASSFVHQIPLRPWPVK